ncbi:hypothetical protein C8R47DRAFT_1230379 [Mycena vitilis]|nr:hypothetical protein C8R47DRAFT_1230379 [Mycena vitilis]
MHLQPEVNLTDAPQSYASTSRHMESPQVPAGFGTEQPRPQFVNPPHTTGLPFPNLGPSAGAHHSSRVPDLMGDSDGNFAAEASSDSDEESSDSEPQYRSPRMKSAVPLFGASTTRTVLDMPLRGSRDAPKLFRGHHSEVEYFIAHYDRLLVKFHVTDPEDQCKLILDYCGTDVQGFIRASKYYHQRKWPKLRHEILQSYDVDRATSRYKPSDIASYTLRTKSKPFQNLSQWKKYYRKYKTMAGTLLHQGHITPLNYDVYFWLGIEPDLRRTLEQRINQLNPGRNVYRQYSVREIHTAAEWYFRRNRAEAMVVNAADYGVDLDSGTTDAESEEESDDSDDSDYEAYRRKHRAKARAKKEKERKNKKKSSTAPATSSKTRTLQTAGTAEEVTSLIRQLNRMSITDPEYAPVYYKVLTLDSTGVAARCVQAPRIAQPWTDANKGFNKGAPAKPPVTSTTGSSTAAVAPAPLTYPNNIPLGAPPPPGCYGCGIDGHRIGECPEIQDLLTKNIIAVDPETRRLRMKDGTFIRRSQGESLAQAARRIAAPRVMFSAAEHPELHDARDMKAVMASLAYVEDYLTSTDTSDTECGADVIYTDQELDAHWYVTKNDISDTESGGEQGEVYLTVPEPSAIPNSEENDVNAAERTMPSSKAARKEIFDGVMLPRRDRLKNDSTPVKAVAAPKESPRGKKDEAPRQVRDLLPELTPVDARQPRDDIDMPDLDLTSRSGGISQKGKGPTKDHGDLSTVKRQDDSNSKNTGRYSDIQATVQIPSIIERILDLTVPMTVREAFVSSKEIRTGILECIKLKNVKAVLLGKSQENPLVAQWNWPRTEGVLIKIDVESRGHIVSAIIDTGSQLDVVRADIAALKIQRPVDMTYVTNMNDANGGKGQLRGYIHGAEINCGGVLTSTDLWVSQQAPFELLLGRPWQRGNMVTIDEREEGKKRQPKEEVQPRESPMNNRRAEENSPYTINLETLPFQNSDHTLHHTPPFPNPFPMPNYYRPYRPGSGRHITSPSPPTPPTTSSNQPRAEAEERRAFPSPLLSMPSAVLDRRREHYFGTVDTHPSGGTIHQRIRAATDIQWGLHRRGLPLTVRPGSLVSPQTSYTGVETRPSGQEVHHAVLLNARLLVHNPITGRPGMRNGHAIVHFFAAPVTDRAWDLETPFAAAGEVERALPGYCAAVHREIERVPTPFPGSRPATRPSTSRPAALVHRAAVHPTPGIPRPIPVYAPGRRSQDSKEEPFRYLTYPGNTPPRIRARNAQQTGLVDASTGLNVLAIPTRAHPSLPADPRPDTPRPPRRLFDKRAQLAVKRAASEEDGDEMDDVQPKKARLEDIEEDLPGRRLASLDRWPASNVRAEKFSAELKETLRRKLQEADDAMSAAADDQLIPPVAILEDGGDAESTGSESTDTSDEDDELESEDDDLPELEYIDVPRDDQMVVDADAAYVAAEAGLSGLKKRVEARAAVKEEAPERKEASVDVVSDEDAMGDSDEEFLGEMGAQPPFSEPGPVGSVPQPPRLRANLPLPIIGEEDTDEPTGQDSRPASPSASPTISEPFSLLSPIDANVPTLSSNFVAVVAPQPRRPTTLVRDIFQRPPPSLLLSSSDSDTLPSLHSISSGRSGVSAGTFNFRRQQDRTGSYFPAAPTVANGRGSPFQSYRFSHRSPSGYAEVDKAEFECHLATIRTLPAASFLDLNERTMDIVRTQLMAQDHDEFLGRQRDEENRKMLLILSRVHEVMSRAGPFLDQAAMRRGEKVNIDLHTYEVDRAESVEEKQDRADEDRDLTGLLSAFSTDAGDGILRVRDDLGIPVSEDGTRVRFLSCSAMLNGSMYRLVLRLLLHQNLAVVGLLSELHELMKEFIHYAMAVMKERRESYDLTLLHQLAHLPPPYLHGYQYARLRILQYMFARGGDVTVVNSIEELLRIRFSKSDSFKTGLTATPEEHTESFLLYITTLAISTRLLDSE